MPCRLNFSGGVILQTRSGFRRSRSGILKAKVIILPPWDFSASQAGPGSVVGTIILLLLLSKLSSCIEYLLGILLFFSALSAAISAASASVIDHPDILL